jgi:enediyne biosynthesis protein E4
VLIASWGLSAPAPVSPISFEDIAAQAGIDFVLQNGATGNRRQIETMVAGAVAFDYDNDDRIDLYFVNGALSPSLEKSGIEDSNHLFRNRGDGSFEDATTKSGLAGRGFGIGGAAADFDNDGDQDLFVAGVNHNTLFRNRGNGTFEDATEAVGLGHKGTGKPWSVSAGWIDFDADADLDLFVVNYVEWSADRDPPCTTKGVRTYCHPRHYKGLPNQLYRNNGNGTFTDVSVASGITQHLGKGMGLAFLDFDLDGRLDIFVANDTVPNFLFRNKGDGSFLEVGIQAGVAFNEDGRAVSSMGADARDLNNDGREDLWVTANANETFPVFLNLGRGLFNDATYPSGVGRVTMMFTGWSNGTFDFNNDGHKDLFAASGSIDNNTEQFSHRTSKQMNRVLANLGDGRFEDVSVHAGKSFQRAAMHRGAAFADFDGDGKVDITVTRIGEPASLFRNTSVNTNHWLAIKLSGRKANRDGIGALIRVRGVSGAEQWNRVTTTVGYGSSSAPIAHFGLGKDAKAAEIEVRWPGGGTQLLRDVAVDRLLRIAQD